MSTTSESVKSNYLSKWGVFFANFRDERDWEDVKRVLIVTLIIAGITSAIREIIRRRLDSYWEASKPTEPGQFVMGEVDPLVIIITAILTMTFYPLLYFAYSYIFKGTEERDTTIVMYNVTLVAQFAILRDLLYILFALVEYGKILFQEEGFDTQSNETPFFVLDGILWILTIILLIPIVVDRLNRPKEREDTQILAFTISVFAFFLTWTFNYQILRIFIQLPLGREV
ncbi:MAG: hypothetical protein GPJ54_20455 [Candidatus Heimdallarchaeota archaeon]|nr:hypothetical protein [Candidatus Heimdallarchaeota archaeon]